MELLNVELEQEVELQTSYELSGGIIPTGEIEINQNGQYDVSSYASADVNVQGGITPTGTKQITIDAAGTTTEDVTNYANVEITVPQGQYKPNIDATPTNPSITVSNGGLITAEIPTQYVNDLLKDTFTEGYIESSDVSMKVKIGGSATRQLNTVNGQTVTPTTSQQSIAVQGDFVLGAINVAPIPSQYIIPTGTKSITDNGTGIDVKAYEYVDVSVSGGGGSASILTGSVTFVSDITVTNNGTTVLDFGLTSKPDAFIAWYDKTSFDELEALPSNPYYGFKIAEQDATFPLLRYSNTQSWQTYFGNNPLVAANTGAATNSEGLLGQTPTTNQMARGLNAGQPCTLNADGTITLSSYTWASRTMPAGVWHYVAIYGATFPVM